MIDRALANLNPVQTDTYYFQLYPLNLTIVGKDSIAPPAGTTYRFTVQKGQQKFDQSKLPIEANFRKINNLQVMLMPKCPLNFYIPSFNKNKKVEFILRFYQTEDNQEYDIGGYIINIEPYVTEFRLNRTVRFEHKSLFSDDYELEFQIYVERTRFALEKVVKDFKVERGLKSPLRQRKEETITPNMRKVLTAPQNGSKKSGISQTPAVEYPVIDGDGKESKEGTEVESSNQEIKQESQSVIHSSGLRENQFSKRASLASEEGKIVNRVAQSEIQTEKVNQSQIKAEKFNKQTKSVLKSKESQNSFLQDKPLKKETKPEIKINKKEDPVQYEKYSQSGVSEKKVPSVNMHLRQAIKHNAPAEITMTESHRLYTGPALDTNDEQIKKRLQPKQWKEQAALIVFMTISLILIYFAMHPSKKI